LTTLASSLGFSGLTFSSFGFSTLGFGAGFLSTTGFGYAGVDSLALVSAVFLSSFFSPFLPSSDSTFLTSFFCSFLASSCF